ncbi:hypothetical protein EAG_12433 [Camponotus floridanus]|uniref:THAP-type domain-containing protein n=1 Tax=Camponotus floridanus TaxID=104421 RepID=E2AAU3_CAMFO|nr:hypothetical protein EAG_12433 [Camponotus floridanus]
MSCCICKSHSDSHEDITFHTIPRSEELRAKWIAVIGRNVPNYSKVCSDHFKPNFFQYKINRKLNKIQRHLIEGAIPTEKFQEFQDLHGARKRKRSADEAITCNKVRTVKFIGDLCPEDLTSPECYEVVKKYLKKHNIRVNSLQKQVGRLIKSRKP